MERADKSARSVRKILRVAEGQRGVHGAIVSARRCCGILGYDGIGHAFVLEISCRPISARLAASASSAWSLSMVTVSLLSLPVKAND